MNSQYFIGDKNISLNDFNTILNNEVKIFISPTIRKKINRSEKFLESLLKKKTLIYGINTGYGPLATTHIPIEKAKELQKNLIYHLATGVGEPFSAIHVRALMLARIICLSKGFSAIRYNSLQTLIDFFNLQIIPVIPSLGTVGASGDLTPLSHLALALIGESKVAFKNKIFPTRKILNRFKLKPITLNPKEGLALVNGTSVMTGIALVNGGLADKLLDISISLSLLYAEILNAKKGAFHTLVGKVKPHRGMKEVIRVFNIRSKGSKRFQNNEVINTSSSKRISYNNELLQDAYSIRCIPQILGAIYDSIEFHNNTAAIELNSVTDNPIFFPDEEIVLHAGNFQGHSIGLVSDTLYNAVTNIAIHSERKIALITDPKLNKDLPPFLQKNQNGLHSGFMGAQVTATSILAWIRSHAIPASIQSISTNANNQDVVSMGTIAALKTSECIERVFEILAIESMVMAQAFELKNGFKKDSGFSDHSIQFVNRVRNHSGFLLRDRSLSEEIRKISKAMKLNSF